MDNTREKLINAIGSTEYGNGSLIGNNFQKGFIEKIADYLISHGVTFATDNKWIPVTERLPDTYRLVLAVCKSGKIFVGEYVDLGWRTLWRIKTARDSTKEITQIVTHWMPLPSTEGLE